MLFKSIIPVLLFFGLLLSPKNPVEAESRAIRPVTIQIPNQGQVELYKGSYALVIGASKYQDNAWGDLSSVGEDVKAVRQALEGQGFQVRTVMDPTEDTLIDEINDFIDAHGYDRDNRLLFYYAGHGYTQERNGRKFGYLVPVDAPNPFDNERAFFRKSLKMEQVLSWAKQIESKHALFVFDSCFSGSVLQSRAITVPEDISYLTAKPVRQFISAGSANQTVPAISVFRPLFIRGINGQADLDKDGYVTGVELGMYLQKQVPRYQTGQTPQYGKILDPYLDEGNFVFEVKRQSPKPKLQAAPPKVASVELGDLQEQADAAKQARLEQQRLEAQREEQAQLELQRVQQQWKEWQGKMQEDYERVLTFEKQAVGNELKIESWQRFLSHWADDNPYSQQDTELRSGAQAKVNYWQNYQKVEPKPQSETDAILSGEAAKKKLLETKLCVRCDLNGVDLIGTWLKGANLQLAQLRDAKLWGGINLSDVNLQGADLRDAILHEANLIGSNLRNADLRGTDLAGAILADADLTGAIWGDSRKNGKPSSTKTEGALFSGLDSTKFCNTKMPDGSINNQDCDQTLQQQLESNGKVVLSGKAAKQKALQTKACIRCDLREANFRGGNLSGANLSGANLREADLGGANLTGADLRGANLRGANLRMANLRMANLRGANLRDSELWRAQSFKADLTGADLTGADLTGSGLTVANFCNTTMPDGSINNRDC